MSGIATEAETIRRVERLEIVNGPAQRRRYSAEEKAELVAQSYQCDISVADFARRHGIHPQVLYRWRRACREGSSGGGQGPLFAEALGGAPGDRMVTGSGEEVMVRLGRVELWIGRSVSPQRVAALVTALGPVS